MSDWRNLPAGHGIVILDRAADAGATRRVMELRTGSILCGRCAPKAAHAMEGLSGVVRARLLWEQDRAVIEYEARAASPNQNGAAPTAESIAAWAVRLIELIEGEAHLANHERACGASGAGLLI